MGIRGFFMKIIDNDLTIQEVCGRIGGYHRCSLEDGYPFLYVSLKFQEIFGWSKEGKRQVICWIENHFKKIDNYIEN